MKYYDELSSIDNLLVELETINGLVTVIANGTQHSDSEDVQKALYFIDESLKKIHNEIREKFDDLWETVRDDYNDGLIKLDQLDYNFRDIEQITKNWMKDSPEKV